MTECPAGMITARERLHVKQVGEGQNRSHTVRVCGVGNDVTAGCLTRQGWECEELVQVLGVPADQPIDLIQDDDDWARGVGRGAPAAVSAGAGAAAAAALLQHLDECGVACGWVRGRLDVPA